MPDGVTPADPGLLASLADELALPGYAMRNMLLGRTGAAGRNLADFALNAVDAPLPGDWIPEISGAEDRPEFTEITGPIDDGLAGSLVNIAGNILTDPVTYIPGAAVAKAGGAIAKGVKAVTPEVIQKGAAKAGGKLRKTFAMEKIGKELENVKTRVQGARETAVRSGGDAIVEGLKGATPRELAAATEVANNVIRDKATRAARVLDETETMSVQDRLARYLVDNPDLDADRMLRILNTGSEVGRGQWASGQAGNVFTDIGREPTSDVVMGAVPGTTAREGIKDYFPRNLLKADEADDLTNATLGQPSPISSRKITTAAQLAEHLNNNPGVELADMAVALGKRNASQGELMARGAAGQGLFDMARAGEIALPDELLAKALPLSGAGPDVGAMLAGTARAPATAEKIAGTTGDVVMGGAKPEAKAAVGLSDSQRKQAREWLLSKQYKQADPLLRETAETIARALPGDEADVALHMLKGMEARKGFPKMLAALNSRFKPVAVFGALVPKLGSITRNMTGGVWQKYSNPEARGTISPKNIPGFLRDWWASMEDGIERLVGKRVFTKNEFAQIDEAYKASGGDPRKALALIKDPDMRSAVERGVFGNNFVDTENLIAQTQRGGVLKFAEKAWDYPAAMFKGAEQRMRYGLYKSLVKAGKSEDDAARIVRESLYDYSQSSMENRLARDVIPFFQFMAKSIPQQAGLMAEKPWLASGVANLYAQGRDEPVSPMMEGKVNIPIGQDEQGNRQYLSNLGLPFESLSMLPNLSANPLQAGRDIEQSVIGSTTPLLKNLYAYSAGQDPTFGSIPGSYTKIAGQDLGELGGFLNQVAGTGLAPLTAAQQIASLTGRTVDDRTTLPEKLLQNLTGARITSVDPDRAIQQRLQAFLERDPTIGQFRTFYDKGDDADAQQLLQNLQEARKALKEKAKAMANVN